MPKVPEGQATRRAPVNRRSMCDKSTRTEAGWNARDGREEGSTGAERARRPNTPTRLDATGGRRTGNDDEGQGRVRKRCAILTESIVRHVDHAARRGGGTWVGVDCRFMQRRRLVLGRTLVWPEDGTAGRYRIPEMRNNTTGKVCFGRPFGGVERPMLPIPRRRELAGSEAEGRKRGEAGRDWTGGIQDQVWS